MKFYAYHKIKFNMQDIVDLHGRCGLNTVLDFLKNIAFSNGWCKIVRILIGTSTVENFNIELFNDGDLIVNYFGIDVYCFNDIGEHEAIVVCS